MIAPFPDKPKGMHHETYERLHQECQEAELKQLIGMKGWISWSGGCCKSSSGRFAIAMATRAVAHCQQGCVVLSLDSAPRLENARS